MSDDHFNAKRGIVIAETPTAVQDILSKADVCDETDCLDNGSSADGIVTAEEADIYGTSPLQAELAKIGYRADFQKNKIFALVPPTTSPEKELVFTSADFSNLPKQIWEILAGEKPTNSGWHDGWEDALFADGYLEDLGWYDDKLVVPNLALISGDAESKSGVLRNAIERRFNAALYASEEHSQEYLYFFPEIEVACAKIASKMGFTYVNATAAQAPKFEFYIDASELTAPRVYQGHEGVLAIETATQTVFFIRTTPEMRASWFVSAKRAPQLRHDDPEIIALDLPRSAFGSADFIETLYDRDTLPTNMNGDKIYPAPQYDFAGTASSTLALTTLPISPHTLRGDDTSEKPLVIVGGYAVYGSDLAGIVERATMVTLLLGAARAGRTTGTAAPPVQIPAYTMQLSAFEAQAAEEVLAARQAVQPASGSVPTPIAPPPKSMTRPPSYASVGLQEPPTESPAPSRPRTNGPTSPPSYEMSSNSSSSSTGGTQTGGRAAPRAIPATGTQPPPLPAQRPPAIDPNMSDTAGPALSTAEIMRLNTPATPPLMPPSAPSRISNLPQILPAVSTEEMMLPAIIAQVIRAPGVDQEPAKLPEHETVEGIVGDAPVVTIENIIEEIRRDADLNAAVSEAYANWQQALADGRVTDGAKWQAKLGELVGVAKTRTVQDKGVIASGDDTIGALTPVPPSSSSKPPGRTPTQEINAKTDSEFPLPDWGYARTYDSSRFAFNSAANRFATICYQFEMNVSQPNAAWWPRDDILTDVATVADAFPPAYSNAMALTSDGGQLPQLGGGYADNLLFATSRALHDGREVDPVYAETVIFDLTTLNSFYGASNADLLRNLTFLSCRERTSTHPDYTRFYGERPGETVIVNFSLIQTVKAISEDEKPLDNLTAFLATLPDSFENILSQFQIRRAVIAQNLPTATGRDRERLLAEVVYLDQYLSNLRIEDGQLQIHYVNVKAGIDKWVPVDGRFVDSIHTSVEAADMGLLAGADHIGQIEAESWRMRNEGVRKAETAATGVAKDLFPDGRPPKSSEVYDALSFWVNSYYLSNEPVSWQFQSLNSADLHQLTYNLAYEMLASRGYPASKRAQQARLLGNTWFDAIVIDCRSGLPFELSSPETQSFITQAVNGFWRPMDTNMLELFRLAGGLRNIHREARVAGGPQDSVAQNIENILAVLRQGETSAALSDQERTKLEEKGLPELLAAYQIWGIELDGNAIGNREQSFLTDVVKPKIEEARKFINSAAFNVRDRYNTVPALHSARTLNAAITQYRPLVATGKVQAKEATIVEEFVEYSKTKDYEASQTLPPPPGRQQRLDPMLKVRLIPQKAGESYERSGGSERLPSVMYGDEGVIPFLGHDTNGEPFEAIEGAAHILAGMTGTSRDPFPIREKTPNTGGVSTSGSNRATLRLPSWTVTLRSGSTITVAAENDPSQTDQVVYLVDDGTGSETTPQMIELNFADVASAERTLGVLEVRVCYIEIPIGDLLTMDPNSPEYAEAFEAKRQELDRAAQVGRDFDNILRHYPDPTNGVYPVTTWP